MKRTSVCQNITPFPEPFMHIYCVLCLIVSLFEPYMILTNGLRDKVMEIYR
jgi:hypothetical protein